MRSWLGLFVLALGYGGAVAVLVMASFWLHILLGFAVSCILAVSVTRALNVIFAKDRPAEVCGAGEGASPR